MLEDPTNETPESSQGEADPEATVEPEAAVVEPVEAEPVVEPEAAVVEPVEAEPVVEPEPAEAEPVVEPEAAVVEPAEGEPVVEPEAAVVEPVETPLADQLVQTEEVEPDLGEDATAEEEGATAVEQDATAVREEQPPAPVSPVLPLFQPPDTSLLAVRAGQEPAGEEDEPEDAGDAEPDQAADRGPDGEATDQAGEGEPGQADEEGGTETPPRRRRRRGGRRRRKGGDSASSDASSGDEEQVAASTADGGPPPETPDEAAPEAPAEGGGEAPSRRRRRRRRAGDGPAEGSEGSEAAGGKARERKPADEITAVTGSTRLEAKKQRRREGREAGRRRAPIVSEAEFLARRESVDRVMVLRQQADLTQIAVLEDKMLVEHYVARESQTSLIGNVYLGRVQNVLPSMEAAFVDIGRGRNAVLYAGEVNWSALGHPEGQPRKIEAVLSSGQAILVQVTKDPVGHKGARLTGQISLAGRFLVYVPDGTTSGISRKLPDTERNRLKTLLRGIVPETAGVIVRTAAEGASEEELTRDVHRLTARWEDVERKAKGGAPKLLYGEPDLTLKVVRDLFTEDFSGLVVEGEEAWEIVREYVAHVAPDLGPRLRRHEREEGQPDVFAAYRIDEQIAKGLDRKVWLPSGGSLIFDRTEAMTVVDVNTGKFTGSGGNLEETVTKNNLEAAEEIVRQLRLRDIGGIIVVDFIDMVLESNRDLVLRRLVECLGRDRTRHQVAEVTSLGLVQMTRKRIGTGLLEAFSESCPDCLGRGLLLHEMPVEPRRGEDEGRRSGRRSRGRGRAGDGSDAVPAPPRSAVPTPRDVAAVARPENVGRPPADAATWVEASSDETLGQPLPVADDAVAAEHEVDTIDQDERDVDDLAVARVGVDAVDVDGVDVDGDEAGEAGSDRDVDGAGVDPTDGEPAEDEDDDDELDDRVEPLPLAVLEDPDELVPLYADGESRGVLVSAAPGLGDASVGSTPGPEAADGEPMKGEGANGEGANGGSVAPRVVTRSRRRGASRPAGPPATPDGGPAAMEGWPGGSEHDIDEAPDESGTGRAGVAEPEAPHVEHVPIKKRGSRKR